MKVLYPTFIGAEKILARLEEMSKASTQSTYPPYNVIKTKDGSYRIEMALAGISKDNIDVELKENCLFVSYTKEQHEDLEEEVDYVYCGISKRNFSKRFDLSQDMIVDGVSMENGTLYIDINIQIPEEKKPKKLTISNKPKLLNG